ncbi:MAG: cobalamin-binding protein [Gammaproteobacteria bacterium]|jgi:iron complex transport system substrate-binding protein|nr:cobalamin-binding protein [Gammaproteobacteria bacterium]
MKTSAWRLLLLLVVVFAMVPVALAKIEVQDDAGKIVSVAKPARRIVSLSPHATELLFAAGAGPYVVGVAAYSDYPQAAGDIPRIGDASGLNLEKIVGLRPDLVVAWKSGNPPRVVKRLEELGIPVFRSEPRSMGDIAENIEDLGMLADTLDVARRESADFRLRYSDLRSRYAHRKAVGVFYQIWHNPLMTVNGQHLISDVIQLCGGINVFSNLPTLTPQIDIEAVLQANPTAIVAAGFNDSTVLDGWKKWTYVDAVKKDNLFLIPFNLIARQSPRILDGAERMCAALQKARASYE